MNNNIHIFQLIRSIDDLQESLPTLKIIFHGEQTINKEVLSKYVNNNDKIIYIPDIIASDDSVRTIKYKIFKYLTESSEFKEKILLEEIYINYITKRRIDKENLFEELNQHKNPSLAFNFYFSNLQNKSSIKEFNSSKGFSYDSLHKILKKNTLFFSPLTTQYSTKKEYLMNANPFKVTEDHLNNMIEDLDFNISCDNKLILENEIEYFTENQNLNIFVFNLFLASDVLKHTFSIPIPGIENYIITHYFPFLKNNDILSYKLYEKEHTKLYKNNLKQIKEVYEKQNTLNIFFDNLYTNNETFQFAKEGFNSIKFSINPPFKFKLNLENIFKLIPTSEEYPLSRINYGKSQDKLYRLYSVEKTRDRKKIPFIDKTIINKVKKLPGRLNTITLYVTSADASIYIDINDNCVIFITIESSKYLSIDEINTITKEKTMPIIKIITKYLSNNGYNLPYFDSLLANNIEIIGVDDTFK